MKKYVILIVLLVCILTSLIFINNKLKSDINNNKDINELKYKDKESLSDKKKELEDSIEAQKIKIDELNAEVDSLNETLENDREELRKLED